jgi:hypothetical protein
MLADALPDKWGNLLIQRWLTDQGRDLRTVTPLERLCFVADRSMGALEFKPAIAPKADADLTEAQMMLYALKDGMNPDGAEAKQQCREMRKAVKAHNEKFPPPVTYRSKASKLRQAKLEKEK